MDPEFREDGDEDVLRDVEDLVLALFEEPDLLFDEPALEEEVELFFDFTCGIDMIFRLFSLLKQICMPAIYYTCI